MSYIFLDDEYLIISKGVPETDEMLQLFKRYDLKLKNKLTDKEFDERFTIEKATSIDTPVQYTIKGSAPPKPEGPERDPKILQAMKKYYSWSHEIIRILGVLKTLQGFSLDDIAGLSHSIISEVKSDSKHILYLEHMITPTTENRVFSHITETALKTTILVISYAVQLKLPYHHFVDLAMGAMLHNIGILNLPESVIFNEGDLSMNEKKQIALIPVYGYKIAKSLNCSPIVCNAILQSREFVNGAGYPLGLSENEILQNAKIISVCSVFASMISDRTYRKRYTAHQSMVAVIKQANKKLSAPVVQDFIRTNSMYPLGSIVAVTGNRYGIVVEIDHHSPKSPFVAIHLDNNTQPQSPAVISTKAEINKITGIAPEEIYKLLTKKLFPTVKEFTA